MTINAISVLPDKAAQEQLRRALAAETDVTLSGLFPDFGAAAQSAGPRPDLVFIDSDHLATLPTTLAEFWPGSAPAVICVTIDRKHAPTAFDLGVTDYLLLPLQPARVRTACSSGALWT